MKTVITELKKLTADDGKVFSNKEKTEVYSNILYLGIEDLEENYIEVTIKEAEAIILDNETEGAEFPI